MCARSYGQTIEVDYRGYDVTVENFLRVLTGAAAAHAGGAASACADVSAARRAWRHEPWVPRSKRLLSDARSNVLVYMTGHGGDEFLKFQDQARAPHAAQPSVLYRAKCCTGNVSLQGLQELYRANPCHLPQTPRTPALPAPPSPRPAPCTGSFAAPAQVEISSMDIADALAQMAEKHRYREARHRRSAPALSLAVVLTAPSSLLSLPISPPGAVHGGHVPGCHAGEAFLRPGCVLRPRATTPLLARSRC